MSMLNVSEGQLRYVLRIVIEDCISKLSFKGVEEGSIEFIEREIEYLEEQIIKEKNNIKSTVLNLYSDNDPYCVNEINDRIRINKEKIVIYEAKVFERKVNLVKIKKDIAGTN